MMLLRSEVKKTVFSITFVVLVIALVVMLFSQDVLNFSNTPITEPQQGQNYGIHQKEVPELIMPEAFQSLYEEFTVNEYKAYPIGFYKNVRLSDEKQEEMANIISILSGVPVEDLLNYDLSPASKDDMEITINDVQTGEDGSFIIDSNNNSSNENDNKDLDIALRTDISYEQFKECMEQADKLIGGGSCYSKSNLLNYSYVAITYEEAMEQYSLAKDVDNFTGAYARLFCDYAGIVLSILPVFIAVAFCLKDKRAKMSSLIYSRKTSSFKLIVCRYTAILMSIMLPTIILAYISNMSVWGLHQGMKLDYPAPLKYSVGWLLPSVMISTAIGMFFTELTNTPIAIGLQSVWWFIDINAGAINKEYSVFHLIPRHNYLGNTQFYIDGLNTLIYNRLLFSGVSVLLVLLTVIVYEQKRRGKLNGSEKIQRHIASLANSKNKSAA